MISHVSVCLLAHGGKSSISNIFCHTKREYSFLVRPIGCTPVFLVRELHINYTVTAKIFPNYQLNRN